MKSPLRYPGGKTRAIKILKEFMPKDIEKVVSPFFGGGSFELALATSGINVVGYDKLSPLVSFWECLLSDKERLHEEILKIGAVDKDKFKALKENISLLRDKFEIAATFYVVNRCSFSGCTLSGGMSPGTTRYTDKSIKNILDFHAMNFSVGFSDFSDVIEKHDGEFLFLDPPYFVKSNLYGNKGNLHKDFEHIKLSELIKKSKSKFLMTYNDDPFIRELYSEFNIHDVNWAYGMNASKKSSEIIITNY